MPSRSLFNDVLYWALIAIVCGSFCYIMAIYPYAMDDLEWAFLINIYDPGYIIRRLLFTDNGRICNLIVSLLLTIPKWISSVILCIGFCAGFLMMIKVADIQRQWRNLSILAFFFIIAPMWEDNMFTMVYGFNYILSIPLLFFCIYGYLNPTKIPRFLGFLVSLLIGVWHESYGLTLLCGWFMMWIFNRHSLNRSNRWYIIGVSIGLIWLFTNPGTWVRQEHYPPSLSNLKRLVFTWFYFAYLLAWIICLFNKRTKDIARKPILVFAAGGFFFIPFVYKTGLERAAFPVMLTCSCATAIMVPLLWKRFFFRKNYIKNIVSALLYIFSVVHLFAIDREASIALPMFEDLCYAFKNTPLGQKHVFAKVRYSWDAPNLTLRRPQWNLFDPTTPNIKNAKTWAGKRWELMAVPEELQNYRHGIGTQLDDNPDLRLWNGHLVSTNLSDTAVWAASTKYKGGWKSELAPAKVIVFPGADSCEYVYIVPKRSVLATYLGEPTEIELIRSNI